LVERDSFLTKLLVCHKASEMKAKPIMLLKVFLYLRLSSIYQWKSNRLLSRSIYLHKTDSITTLAQADLNSAWEIIELYAVDYLALHGRYSLATADFDTALNHYQEAKQLIEEIGQWGLMPRWEAMNTIARLKR
jgi:hypothetical protein